MADRVGDARAENVLAMLEATAAASARIYKQLPSETKPAFFELVHHPAQASLTLAQMWIAAGINQLRASQARISANEYKDRVEQLFEDDYALEMDYHAILEGEFVGFVHSGRTRSVLIVCL